MVDYGLKDRVAIVTGANNPWGIGATTALAFAREGAKVVLVYKKLFRPFDENKTDVNGVDRYFKANAEDASVVEERLKEQGADYLILESDISSEASVKEQKFGLSTGNFQTLVELSKEGFGNTVLPYLNTLTLPEADREMLRDFTTPTPSRQISLIHMQDSLRHKVNESLITTIRGIIRAMIVYENTRITSPLEV